MRTIVLRFVGGRFDGRDYPWRSGPPPYLLSPTGNYVLFKWDGKPNYVAHYRPAREPLPWAA